MYQAQKSELARYGNFNEVRVILFLILSPIDNIDEIQFSFGGFNFLFLILGHISYQTEEISVDLYEEHDAIKSYYIPPTKKDIVKGLTMEDVIVLQEPKQEYKESINSNGYEFYKNIKTNIKYYLAKYRNACHMYFFRCIGVYVCLCVLVYVYTYKMSVQKIS